MLICPKCKHELILKENAFVCSEGHLYDRAKEGYVNLSLKQKKNAGDNKFMVQARSAFLEKGYYSFLREELASLLETYKVRVLLDAGCGEGYYTRCFSNLVSVCYGIDLSKEAIRHAAKHDKHTLYIVSSIFACPFPDKTLDAITSIFVPPSFTEFYRLLKSNGLCFEVVPGPRHCFELKEVLYENPYENETTKPDRKGFVCQEERNIKKTFLVKEVWELLEMTPYRYKTKKESLEKVKTLDSLTLTFDFIIRIWRKV